MPVSEWLFMFTAQAVAEEQTGFRAGARHAIMAFVTAVDLEAADRRATHAIARRHWLHVEIKRGKQVFTLDGIDDTALLAAAEAALREGDAIVVYGHEIAADG